ncbi:MAG: protein translocase subunit SecD [Clostridia bacterium]|nr:protein translocase subunit SecD [Clostridia bacterium]
MGKSIAKLLVVLLLIAALLAVAFVDFTLMGYDNYGAFNKEHGVKRGLDLTGGASLTFEADAESATAEEMNTVVKVMRNRLDRLNYTEANVSKQGDKRVYIEIPDVANPDEAKALLGQTAQLTFCDADEKVVMTGKEVKSAKKMYGQYNEMGATGNYIELKLTQEGVKAFSEATAAAAARTDGKNYIAIKLDDEVISAPFVETAITDDTCIITGDFTAEAAENLASLISAGQLPFNLNLIETRTVGPTLGANALESSMKAAAIGILIVLIFMIIMYRIPGLAASIALCAYVAILAFVMGHLHLNLTLPGFAGIILSVGMAVDANVVIFERIKEEIKLGKTIRAAVGAGFKRAFTAIIDSNITTLIAAAVLYFFGTGTIKGFATTLGLGIIVSMFTAIVITKFILNQLVGICGTNKVLYGGKKNKEAE